MTYDFSNESERLFDKTSGRVESDARFWIRYFRKNVGWLDTNCCLHRIDGRVICPTGIEPAILLPGEDVTKIEYVDNYREHGIECSAETVSLVRSRAQLNTPSLLVLTPSASAPESAREQSLADSGFSANQTSTAVTTQQIPTESVLALQSTELAKKQEEDTETRTYQTEISNITLSTSIQIVAKQSTKRAQLVIINAGNSRVWVNTIPNFTVGTGIPIQAAGGQLKLTRVGGLDICAAQFFALAEATTNIVVIQVTEID